jgi:hypothetical protein
VNVRATTDAPGDTGADTIAIGVFEDKPISHDVADGALQALVDSGEARTGLRKVAVTHADGRRWILAGLGRRDDFDAERARVAAAVTFGRAQELGTRSLCWEVPHRVDDDVIAGLVEGTLLAAYRFDAYKSGGGDEDGRLRAVEQECEEDEGVGDGDGRADAGDFDGDARGEADGERGEHEEAGVNHSRREVCGGEEHGPRAGGDHRPHVGPKESLSRRGDWQKKPLSCAKGMGLVLLLQEDGVVEVAELEAGALVEFDGPSVLLVDEEAE